MFRTKGQLDVAHGIGWKNSLNDLRQIYQLWEHEQIDSLYTLPTLDRFQEDLLEAARLRNRTTT